MTGDCEFRTSYQVSSQVPGDADPGVISEGESEDGFTVSITSVFICTPSPTPCFKEVQL